MLKPRTRRIRYGERRWKLAQSQALLVTCVSAWADWICSLLTTAAGVRFAALLWPLSASNCARTDTPGSPMALFAKVRLGYSALCQLSSFVACVQAPTRILGRIDHPSFDDSPRQAAQPFASTILDFDNVERAPPRWRRCPSSYRLHGPTH